MTIVFGILAGITVAGAVAAMTWRNLVHCALGLVIAFGGIACLFLQLGAQFVGLAQLLVYVGAVAILIVFAILLTRSGQDEESAPVATSWGWVGVAIAAAVFSGFACCICRSPLSAALPKTRAAAASVKEIGQWLMHDAVFPLEVLGMLLTAALIGAVVLLLQEKSADQPGEPRQRPADLLDSGPAPQLEVSRRSQTGVLFGNGSSDGKNNGRDRTSGAGERTRQ